MTDYAEPLILARKALSKAEAFALGGRWAECAAAFGAAVTHAEQCELYARRKVADEYLRNLQVENARRLESPDGGGLGVVQVQTAAPVDGGPEGEAVPLRAEPVEPRMIYAHFPPEFA